MSGPRILVVGAGIVGLATALELARRGARVEVLDRQPAGRESSWAGAGILSLLLPGNYGRPLRDLADFSTGLYPNWIDELRHTSRTDPEFRRTGMLVLPPFEADTVERSPAPQPPPRPQVSLGDIAAENAFWMPEVAQVRNPHLLAALTEAAHHLGIPIHTHRQVTALEEGEGRIIAIRTGRERWTAEHYVLAAGAWTAQLLGPLAEGLPVRPIRGQMLLYQAPPMRLPCIVYQAGHYLVPRQDGLILVGSTLEDVGFDKATTAAARHQLQGFLTRLLPDVAASNPIKHWAGLRPGSPDNRPIVARHPRLANLFVNSGHFRYGVTLAPASARLLANVVLGEEPALDPRLFAWPDIIRAGPV